MPNIVISVHWPFASNAGVNQEYFQNAKIFRQGPFAKFATENSSSEI